MKRFHHSILWAAIVLTVTALAACKPIASQTTVSQLNKVKTEHKPYLETAVVTQEETFNPTADSSPTQLPTDTEPYSPAVRIPPPAANTPLIPIQLPADTRSYSAKTPQEIRPTDTPLTAVNEPPSTFPQYPIAYTGEEIPAHNRPINAENRSHLTQVAQWGNGDIRSVAFSPDGTFFIVGSAVGFAIYDNNAPTKRRNGFHGRAPIFMKACFLAPMALTCC